MELIKVVPRGYCKGVVRAINIAKETAKNNPDKNIYILGMLVHNKYVIDALKEFNIITIDDKNKSREELLDQIEDGIVIFTAHGIHPFVKKKAEVYINSKTELDGLSKSLLYEGFVDGMMTALIEMDE